MFEISFSDYDRLVKRAEESGYQPYIKEKKDIVDLLYLQKNSIEAETKRAVDKILSHDLYIYDADDEPCEDKFCLTFDEYDELESISESSKCRALIPDENTLFRLLCAAVSDDLNYKRAIRDILCAELYLVHEEVGSPASGGKEKLNVKDVENIIATVQNIDLSGCSFFPTKEELNRFVGVKNKENVAFLCWLTGIDPESLSSEQLKVQKYAGKLLKEMVGK